MSQGPVDAVSGCSKSHFFFSSIELTRDVFAAGVG